MSSPGAVVAVLEPQGSMDVSKAKAFCQELLGALSEHSGVTLKLSGVSDADMSFFQLLCAAHREATSLGKSFQVDSRSTQEPIRKLVVESGMARDLECHHAKGHKCLWWGEGWI